jgi:uncharacterized membrane protein
MSDEMNFDNAPKGEITSDDKLWAALSLFLPIFGIIALLMEDKKARPFIKHAAINGLALGVVLFAVSLVLGFIPLVGCFTIFLWIYPLYLAIQAYNGEWANIPVVSDFVKSQGWL